MIPAVIAAVTVVLRWGRKWAWAWI